MTIRRRTKRDRRDAEELAVFCREVDLVSLARSYGYRLDDPDAGRASDGTPQAPPGAWVLIHRATGDRLTVWREPDGVWKYSSTVDRLHGRTVLEFLLNRRGLGMGYVRKDLRWWLRETRRNRGR